MTPHNVRCNGSSPRANYAPVWFSACPRQSSCAVTEQCIHCKACVDLVEAGDITQVHALPASQVGTQGKVHILSSGTAVPAANIHDCAYPPHSSSAIEVEEGSRGEVCVLLTLAVVVQRYFLCLEQQCKIRTLFWLMFGMTASSYALVPSRRASSCRHSRATYRQKSK